MPLGFDLYMVTIEWEKSNQYLNIIRGQKPLKPNIVGDTYEYDLVMYTKEKGNYYQFAIHTKGVPFIETKGNDGKNTYEKLFQVYEDLWIIKNDWRMGHKGGYHYCPSINSKGVFNVVLSQNKRSITDRVRIDVNPNR